MPRIENTAEGPRGFCVDNREYLVPARQTVGEKVINGALDVDDAVIAKAFKEPVMKGLFDEGTLVVVGAKAASKAPEDDAGDETPKAGASSDAKTSDGGKPPKAAK